jgi:hypothetical protein
VYVVFYLICIIIVDFVIEMKKEIFMPISHVPPNPPQPPQPPQRPKSNEDDYLDDLESDIYDVIQAGQYGSKIDQDTMDSIVDRFEDAIDQADICRQHNGNFTDPYFINAWNTLMSGIKSKDGTTIDDVGGQGFKADQIEAYMRGLSPQDMKMLVETLGKFYPL